MTKFPRLSKEIEVRRKIIRETVKAYPLGRFDRQEQYLWFLIASRRDGVKPIGERHFRREMKRA